MAAPTESIASTRPRRQSAIRGLERISTALATHGMGRDTPGGGEDAPYLMPELEERVAPVLVGMAQEGTDAALEGIAAAAAAAGPVK